jgi:hypothetical protein
MNKNLKKKKGGDLYNYLVRNFDETSLEGKLREKFALLSDLRQIKPEAFTGVKALLNLQEEEKTHACPGVRSAKAMLDEAGYVLVDNIEKKEDYLEYEKYFREGEKLCKFSSYDATRRYSKLFFILKKGFEGIQPAESPKRQDDYGTSIMSVGISPDRREVRQITSRYNHKVPGCDNTFNSNLDNIVEGLTEAFNRDYSLRLSPRRDIEFENFYISGGKYFHYFREVNARKIGRHSVDGKVYDPGTFLVFDTYVLDIKGKKITSIAREDDAFEEIVNKELSSGGKIKIGGEGEVLIGGFYIRLNEENEIVELRHEGLESVGKSFLYLNNNLRTLSLPNLKKAGWGFLYSNRRLKSLSLPSLEVAGNGFLYNNRDLGYLYLPRLKSTGDNFLYFNNTLESLYLPSLEFAGNNFLYDSNNLRSLSLPSLEVSGHNFLYFSNNLEYLYLPRLKSTGGNFLCNSRGVRHKLIETR